MVPAGGACSHRPWPARARALRRRDRAAAGSRCDSDTRGRARCRLASSACASAAVKNASVPTSRLAGVVGERATQERAHRIVGGDPLDDRRGFGVAAEVDEQPADRAKRVEVIWREPLDLAPLREALASGPEPDRHPRELLGLRDQIDDDRHADVRGHFRRARSAGRGRSRYEIALPIIQKPWFATSVANSSRCMAVSCAGSFGALARGTSPRARHRGCRRRRTTRRSRSRASSFGIARWSASAPNRGNAADSASLNAESKQ